MKALVQRVLSASVTIPEQNYQQQIEKGLLILVGIKLGDTIDDAKLVADKCSHLRIFEDAENKMNISVKDVEGEVLVISQFTLYGETAKGNRPNFTAAAKPDEAVPLYEYFLSRVKLNLGDSKVKSGLFGAMMNVELVNYGPVTVIVESNQTEKI